MIIEKKEDNSIVVLTVTGAEKLNNNNAKEFKELLMEAIKEHPRVILNLEKVNFIDSSGLGVIVAGLKRIKKNNGELGLAVLQPPIKLLFELTQLYKVFSIFDSVEQGVSDFNK